MRIGTDKNGNSLYVFAPREVASRAERVGVGTGFLSGHQVTAEVVTRAKWALGARKRSKWKETWLVIQASSNDEFAQKVDWLQCLSEKCEDIASCCYRNKEWVVMANHTALEIKIIQQFLSRWRGSRISKGCIISK